MQYKTAILPGVAALALTAACGGGESALPDEAPTVFERIVDKGFQNAGAVDASPDGATLSVPAYDDTNVPTIFSVDVAGRSLAPIVGGVPLLYPSDLATSCDGDTLFVSDLGIPSAAYEIGGDPTPAAGGGSVYAIDLAGGSMSQLAATGIARATGIAMGTDCKTLFVAGFTTTEEPAVFALPIGGGEAEALHAGAPFRSPTGLHVDEQDTVWMLDHAAHDENGEGVLFSITRDGDVNFIASGLGMGRHGGCSLAPGGKTAVIPITEDGKTMLFTANTETGELKPIAGPDLEYPTGVAAASAAPVMVVASETAIFSAIYE